MFVEAIEAILHDQFTPAAIRAAEGGDAVRTQWDVLAEAGFLELLTPEAAGGASLTLSEIFPVLVCIGWHALPVPLAQSIAARGLLQQAGATPPAGMITLAQSVRRLEDGGIECAWTPFGTSADHVLAGVEDSLLVLDASLAERAGTGVHGDQSATLRWPRGAVPLPLEAPGMDVETWGAALHAALIAGAASRVFELTLQYCNDRSQFGRSIGKYQAIQHQLSVMAEQVAATSMAAEMAFAGRGLQPDRLLAAIAKGRGSEAAAWIAATAHALHGAIGVTEEYDLQLLTRRLHAWRIAHGSEAFWSGVLGQAWLARRQGHAVDFVRQVQQRAG
ncbi:acyl-CoA dehydrogenase family protein [Cupriavidus pinatubonensis]|uniref:Crotonobetainyl-CoA reductase n=1 Tax=Cupriavidus pinatubonensis TaxID=248026 RepID=A0ABN7XYC8_9BURK|nr:acyl-CoA dehydrogenase family protein [Cupriavidus pinatubonensis]CAG9166145.1 Crotonobetainyl-CoA reductase [Cupriavidus pinatubonensis]